MYTFTSVYRLHFTVYTMTSSVKDILSKTNQQVGLLDDEKKMAFAQDMAGFAGLKAAFTGQLGVQEFRTIIEGKRLLAQHRRNQKHHGHH